MVELADVRTYLLVPLREDDELIGALGITREQVQPFTDRQIDLVADFAAQATTALESTRRERQYREAQMALAHTNRVATLGQLTGSIAHELRQPLSAVAVSGSTTLRRLAMQPPEYEKAKGAAERVIEGTRRAIDIVTGLTDLTKKQGSRKDLIDINDAIMDVNVVIHSEALKSGVSVHTDFASYLPRVKGDRVQLQQVILNLIVNAVQAMSGLDSDRRDLLISTDTVGAEGVRVGVRDNGPGLTSESLPRLFEPFYTTKADGMGMNLAICRSIIETHGDGSGPPRSSHMESCFSLRSLPNKRRHRSQIIHVAFCSGFWTPAITRRSAGSARRRPKSANARSRGKHGTRQCSECYGDRMLVAISIVDPARAECLHNFRVLA